MARAGVPGGDFSYEGVPVTVQHIANMQRWYHENPEEAAAVIAQVAAARRARCFSKDWRLRNGRAAAGARMQTGRAPRLNSPRMLTRVACRRCGPQTRTH